MSLSNTSVIENVTSANNVSAISSLAVETTTLLNNLTTTLLNSVASENASFVTDPTANATNILQQPNLEDGGHKNPELKYFSTVIIIFIGLTILIVPVFCFIGAVLWKARIFKTVREAAGRGWGFGDLNVPYSEFGAAEDYKSDSAPTSSSGNTHCDVKILVAEDNTIPSSGRVRKSSFLRANNTDEDDDISSLPPTFVHRSA